MRIADTTDETPPGTVVRVAPTVPRSALNNGETDAVWVMFGAPPTGGPDEWDPGAEILEQRRVVEWPIGRSTGQFHLSDPRTMSSRLS